MKNKIIALLLAFLAGGFGIHKFYLGQPVKGVLYLLFFWTLIPSFLALYDGISLAFMSDEKFDMLYNPQLFQKKGNATLLLNVADELEKLDALFQKGVITFEEFETQKAKLLQH